MAAETYPTQDRLLREALSSANSLEKYARAKTEWFPEVLRDIANRRDWKALEASAVVVLTENKQRVALPTDYSRWIKFALYWGASGTATAGAASSLTLAVAETVSEADAKGRQCLLTGGTGSGQFRGISTYNESSKVATLVSAWTTNPASGTTYVVGLQEQTLDFYLWDDHSGVNRPALPLAWTEFDQQIVFNTPPPAFTVLTQAAGLLDYYVDIDRLDLTSDEMGDLYGRWRMALVSGVKYRAQLERGDGRAVESEKTYERAIMQAARSDQRQRRGNRSMAMVSIGGLPRL